MTLEVTMKDSRDTRLKDQGVVRRVSAIYRYNEGF